jgi:HEAT repeat protein
MATDVWQRFFDSFLSDPGPVSNDDLDLDAVRSLETGQRPSAERKLLERLNETGDERAIIGLGELTTLRALDTLGALLPDADDKRRRLIKRAIWMIQGRSDDTVLMIDTLKADPFWGHRMRAAITLEEHRTDEAGRALEAALDDLDPLVRFHAATALCRGWLGEENEAEVNKTGSELMGPEFAAAAVKLRERRGR